MKFNFSYLEIDYNKTSIITCLKLVMCVYI